MKKIKSTLLILAMFLIYMPYSEALEIEAQGTPGHLDTLAILQGAGEDEGINESDVNFTIKTTYISDGVDDGRCLSFQYAFTDAFGNIFFQGDKNSESLVLPAGIDGKNGWGMRLVFSNSCTASIQVTSEIHLHWGGTEGLLDDNAIAINNVSAASGSCAAEIPAFLELKGSRSEWMDSITVPMPLSVTAGAPMVELTNSSVVSQEGDNVLPMSEINAVLKINGYESQLANGWRVNPGNDVSIIGRSNSPVAGKASAALTATISCE